MNYKGSYFNRLIPALIAVIILSGAAFGQVTPPSGIIGWYAGDGDARDNSGNGNNGALQSGASYAVGRVGQGFQFNGSGSVTVADAPGLNPTAQISIEGWVYPTTDSFGANSMAVIINKETNVAVQYEMARRLSSGGCPTGGGIPTGNFAVYIGGIAGLPDDCGGWVNGNAPLPLNVWSHVATTYDGANLRFFVNGTNTRTVAATGAISTGSGILRLGKRLVNAEAWIGQLDEMSIYNRALSSAEIQSINNAGINGKTKQSATNAGANSQIVVGDATITFNNISTAGTTTDYTIDPTTAGMLPSGYTQTGLAYNISTTAVYSGLITECFHIPSINDATVFSRLKVLHSEGGMLVDRTSSYGFSMRLVCGRTTSLSPFVIANGLVPTAANVAVGGRLTIGNRGVAKAAVLLTGADGIARSAITNPFGYYRFEDVAVGETYIIEVRSKRYTFATQVLNITEEMSDLNFYGN